MRWPTRQRMSQAGHVRLATERLILRPAAYDDFEIWAEAREKNYPYLKPFEPSWPADCLSRDFFRRRVERLDQDWMADRGYAFIILKGDDLIGGININNVTRGAAQFASLGYWLDENFQGNGYMTEAARAVLDYAFDALHLSRMNAATLVHNEKSKNMLRRLGFSEEGFARAYIQIDGKRQDHILFGLNRDEFLSPARYA